MSLETREMRAEPPVRFQSHLGRLMSEVATSPRWLEISTFTVAAGHGDVAARRKSRPTLSAERYITSVVTEWSPAPWVWRSG